MPDLLDDHESVPVFATKAARYFAIVIDYLVYFLFFYLMVTSFGSAYTDEDGSVGFRLTGLPALGTMLFWFVMPILEGLTSQSFGKMLLGIKVMQQDGRKVSFGNALVRHLFDMVDFFPFLGIVGLVVSSNNSKNQRVGDLVAKTIVVKK